MLLPIFSPILLFFWPKMTSRPFLKNAKIFFELWGGSVRCYAMSSYLISSCFPVRTPKNFACDGLTLRISFVVSPSLFFPMSSENYFFSTKILRDGDCCRCSLTGSVGSTLHEIASALGAPPRTPLGARDAPQTPSPLGSAIGLRPSYLLISILNILNT